MAIRVLPADVINQIAAGEVVERPAHLMKELVENALDAGSTEIEVEVEQGGRCIRVQDNGAGIAAHELAEALKRHATSKIETAFDLWNLSSFGFRGEALASIAAVSRLTLTSRQKDAEFASRITSDFGVVSPVESVGGSFGTSVEVRELFANIPARLKFLKSESAELTHIKNIFKALGLKNPQVQFRLKANGKSVFFWLKESPVQRVQRILELQELYEGEFEEGETKVKVYLSAPHSTVSTSRGLWFFAQGRFVQDRVLQSALLEAYRGLLMHGEYPMAVVMVQVEPEDIDVNIHPTKSQVKFLDSSKIFRAVQRTVRSVLEKAPWLPERLKDSEVSQPPPVMRQTPMISEAFQAPEFAQVQYVAKPSLANFAPQVLQSPPPVVATVGPKKWSSLQILGQLRLTYVLAQTDLKLLLIDQHAAHERVAYEKLMHAWTDGAIDVQKYLIPLTMDLDAGPMEALLKSRTDLLRFGVEIEPLSPTCLSISGAPSLLSDSALLKGLERLATEAFECGESFAIEKVVADVCATMACHSVVRAGQALSLEQMHELLTSMDEFPLSSFCPHGRPVCVEWSFEQIEREFGRIV